jgi:transposase InsO family protein
MKRRWDEARENEHRLRALRILEAFGNTPDARRKVAQTWGVTVRTLRRWAARHRAGEPLVRRRGRPPDEVPRDRRQGVIRALLKLGPCAGVNVVRGLFMDVPYRTIAKLKRRLARAIRRRRGWHRRCLRWLLPGSVWATDFTKPRAGLPGSNTRLCLVRDLASGAQLAAVPCKGEQALVAGAVLALLFLLLGPPLVLKHDGGSAFIAHSTQHLLEEHGVVSLRSPPRTPQYNGACERAGGTLKLRIEHAALIGGHPGTWTEADITTALLQANTTARPRGANGSTPAEALAKRPAITDQEREAFKRTIEREAAIARKTHKLETGRMPTCSERAAIDRKAKQAALCEHGYLELRRGRLSTLISTWRADTNT